MKKSTLRYTVAGLSLVVLASLGAKFDAQRDAARMADAANALLSSLPSDERAAATFDFDADERQRFHFIPPEMFERRGAHIKAMNDDQKEKAFALLGSGMSATGYRTTRFLMELEGVLAGIEGEERRFRRDSEDYWIAVFGTPSNSGSWGWRFEGHHISLHFTVVNGQATVSAPTFLAANPAEVPSGPQMGARALRDQEDRGRRLVNVLTNVQRRTAVIADAAPRDIVTGVELRPDPLNPVGIGARQLNAAQKTMLMDLIRSYTDLMSDEIAAARWAGINDADPENITFAWAGSTDPGGVAYYRVQGPTFLIEFDNTANDPNHIHTTWRDFEGDFGRDLLRDHVGGHPH